MKRYDPNNPFEFSSSGMKEVPNGDYINVEDLIDILYQIRGSEEYCESNLEEFINELEKGT